MKRLLLLFGIAALISSCSNTNNDPTPSGPTSKYQKYAGENELKIMSFNVRTSGMDKDTPNHWEHRKEACIALIKDQKPTLIGFQEAVYSAQWEWIKDQLKSEGYDGYGIDRINGYPEFNNKTKNGEVPGILWNTHVVKILDKGTFWLSETPDTPSMGWDAGYYRSATWGLFEHIPTGDKFVMINTHLDHESETAQVEGMKLIANKLKEYEDEDYPLFLTGDFNVVASDKALEPIKDFMRNARTYAHPTDNNPTVNGFGDTSSKKKIDHIYYSDYLKIKEYYTIVDSYSGVTYVSDHYPIYAIIKLQ